MLTGINIDSQDALATSGEVGLVIPEEITLITLGFEFDMPMEIAVIRFHATNVDAVTVMIGEQNRGVVYQVRITLFDLFFNYILYLFFAQTYRLGFYRFEVSFCQTIFRVYLENE